jgi:NTE family protein
VLAIASLGGAVAFIDATIVNIAFPDIERSFPGTSISTLSWVMRPGPRCRILIGELGGL